MGTSVGVGLSGCAGPVDFPDRRRLVAYVNATQAEKGWSVNVTVENDNTMRDAEATFHEVTIVVYSSEGKRICDREIGDVSYKRSVDNGATVNIDCPKRPKFVTFDAAESPCGERTSIGISVYQDQRDESGVWDTTFNRQCNEGLPPDFERLTSSSRTTSA